MHQFIPLLCNLFELKMLKNTNKRLHFIRRNYQPFSVSDSSSDYVLHFVLWCRRVVGGSYQLKQMKNKAHIYIYYLCHFHLILSITLVFEAGQED